MLTLRQQAFLGAYLSGPPGVRGNALAAAEAVGYSRKNTGVGTHLLDVPAVKVALEKHLAKADIRTDWVLAEMAAIAKSRMRDVAEWGPDGVKMRASTEISDATDATIAEVSDTEHGVRVKLHDKLGALRDLGKYLKIFSPTNGEDTPGATVFNTQINVTNLAALTDEQLEALERVTARD